MPLLFDMPLEKLKTYSGTNPKPSDFETFWDAGLVEMQALDAQVELIPAEFQTPFAECFHLYFNGVGGSRVHAKLLRPRAAAQPHPALVRFHGYSGNAGSWTDHLAYVASGFTVASLDCRGQGGRSEDRGGVVGNTLRGHIIRGLDGPPENMLFRQIFLDTAQLAGIVMDMEEVDAERVGAVGGSQGGGLTLACVALEPRIKLAAPDFPFLSDYRRVWDLDLDQNAYEELRAYFRLFDPTHEREAETFTKLGYIDIQHLAPRIKAEVKMTVCLMDQICPPLDSVRGLQQDHRSQIAHNLPRLRPRTPRLQRRHDVPVSVETLRRLHDDRNIDIAPFECGAAIEKRELNQKLDLDEFPSRFFDQPGRGRRRATGGQQVVNQHDTVPRLERILMDRQCRRPVLEIIALLKRLIGQLALLADGNEPKPEPFTEHTAKEESAGVDCGNLGYALPLKLRRKERHGIFE